MIPLTGEQLMQSVLRRSVAAASCTYTPKDGQMQWVLSASCELVVLVVD